MSVSTVKSANKGGARFIAQGFLISSSRTQHNWQHMSPYVHHCITMIETYKKWHKIGNHSSSKILKAAITKCYSQKAVMYPLEKQLTVANSKRLQPVFSLLSIQNQNQLNSNTNPLPGHFYAKLALTANDMQLQLIRKHIWKLQIACFGTTTFQNETVLPSRTTVSVLSASAPEQHPFTFKWQNLRTCRNYDGSKGGSEVMFI